MSKSWEIWEEVKRQSGNLQNINVRCRSVNANECIVLVSCGDETLPKHTRVIVMNPVSARAQTRDYVRESLRTAVTSMYLANVREAGRAYMQLQNQNI